MIQRIKKYYNGLLQRSKPVQTTTTNFIKKHPFTSLFALLGILLVLIIVSNILNRPEETDTKTEQKPKKVEIYQIGSAPKITVQAQIEKSGVVTINALQGGVVQSINVAPGDRVYTGNTLVSLSTTYQGGNLPALQLGLASAQLKNVNDTYNTQKELISKQREIATKGDDNSDQLRDISSKSIDETKNLISLNDQILETINSNIDSGVNVDTNRQLKSQFTSANNQLRSALRNTEYSAAGDKPPADLSNLQKDIAQKQLDLQEKALDLTREITRLQYQIAAVGAQSMMPAAPFNATVQRVLVKMGDSVAPGTPLMVLSQTIEEDPIVAIAYVPRETAQQLSYYEPSILSIGDFTYEAYPSYVTQDAVSGSLYAVYFPIPDNFHKFLTNNGYIRVEIPVGNVQSGAAVPFVPIDAVYQTEDSSYIFISNKGKVESRKITLGPVTGRYVQVIKGINAGDSIILDRNVVAGDAVEINQ